MNVFTKTLAAGAAALTLAIAFAPAAEAKFHHGGHGWHGGHGHNFGHRWHGRRHWGPGVVGYGVYGGGCYIARKRVWDDYRGRFIFVRRSVCG
jgi:hypothetical protein